MSFISKFWLLTSVAVVCAMLVIAGCNDAPDINSEPKAVASQSVSPTPRPTPTVAPFRQKPLPSGIDKRAIAAAKLHGWAIDASKTTHKVHVLRYNPVSGNLSVALRVGAQFGGYHYDCKSRTSCFTSNGEWKTYRKEGKDYESSEYPKPDGGAPMPWATFFHGGQAFHYGNSTRSHGCIHIYKMSAAKFIHDLPMGTVVVVHK